ncbi:unnamed protein product [Clonostachys rosea f. rosea IK726]|jgi:hypothetical protein|uniref:Uncharacterized protein n=1 Tax=Clonostachys rosea f. rosea IK726 TaxID=1349383 RepID=A0ACA9UB58_BIOOC|nr:unnamed protein product [Clonostachys rosea f. rosea IK726]
MGRDGQLLSSKQAPAANSSTAVPYSQNSTCLSTRPRAGELGETSADEVIFLGALPRRPDHATAKTPAPNRIAADDNVHKPRKNEFTRLHRKLPNRGTKATRGLKGSSRTTVPASIRNQNIRIGHARNSNAHVFGLFDEAGYFRRRAEVDRSHGRGDPGPFIVLDPISHKQVSYNRPFLNMSSKQVRSEALRRLMKGITDSASQGEV